MVLGLGAIGLGGQQLWGGWPLIENKIAKEDGEWSPAGVPEQLWISTLESSVERAPNFRRYLKLGILYQSQAMKVQGEERDDLLVQAMKNYRIASERHPYSLVSRINIAKIETDRGDYIAANDVYKSISKEASSRERWFRMHSLWAAMQLRWARVNEQNGEDDEANKHYTQSLKLYRKSKEIAGFDLNHQWLIEYSRALLVYARYLDRHKRFDEAEEILHKCMQLADWVNNSKYTGLYMERGRHYYLRARQLWFKRKPEEAAKLVKTSLQLYTQHKRVLKGEVNDSWKQAYKEAKEMDEFFINTGVGQKRKGTEH
jgi:tetratricopeptide (TPR) repeat protein